MTRRSAWWGPIRLGAWFGMVSGFAEALARLLRKVTMGEGLHLGAYVAWMPAATNGVLLLLVGVALAPLAWAFPRRVTPVIIAGLLATLAWFDVVWLWTPPLELYAVWLVAAGLGLQTARLLAPRMAGFERVTRWSAPALLGLVAVLGVGIERARALHERRALAAAPAAARERPNVLLLVLDTVRLMNLSAYGYFRSTTPTMERVAARGVRFLNPVAPAPWTLPSHAAMFTGRWLHEQGTGWKAPLDDRWPTLAERLTAAGWATAGFVANNDYCDREYGLARGFAHYEDYPLTWKQALRSSHIGLWLSRQPALDARFGPRQRWTRKTATTIVDDFLAWEGRGQEDRPWFAFLNFFDAHRAYYAPPAYDSLFRGDSALAPPVPRQPGGPVTERRYRPQPVVRYDRGIRYIDDELARLLAELERRGALANTLVIITSDHGEEFEERGLNGHGSSLYFASIAVPLVMAFPGRVPAGAVVPATVSLRDLAATIMDLTGAPSPAPFPGASLARYWSGAAPTAPDTVLAELDYAWNKPAWYPVSRGNMKSVLTGADHLIRNGDGSHEFYDVRADVWEQHDRSGDSALAGQVAALGALLRALPSPAIPAGRGPAPATDPAKDQDGSQP